MIAAGPRRRITELDIEPEVLLVAFVGLMLVAVIGLAIWTFTTADGRCAGDACAEAAPIGISRTSDGSSIALHYLRCGDEAVTRIAIEEAEAGSILWELKGDYRGARIAFVAGQPTDEMTETVAFTDLPTTRLRAVVEAEETHERSFQRNELLAGYVLYEGFALTADEFVQIARTSGTCPDWVPALAVGPARALQLALLGMAAIAGTVWAVRMRPAARGERG